METTADYVFEISWEICNKVGGIYTVIKSKAAKMKENYPNLLLVGPYVEKSAKYEFLEEDTPKELESTFKDLEGQGIKAHYGTWQAKGDPKTILLEFQALYDQKDQLKKDYWDSFKVDSLHVGWGYEEPMVWATAAGKLVESFAKNHADKKVVAHAHEWLSGFAILHLKKYKAKVATVFTTHATMLGRVLASAGYPLYEELDKLNPEEEARNRGVMDKYSTEVACAQNADIFTTVSEITALEAEKILGRKPEVLVLNGLDIAQFPSFEETSVKHRENRDIIREFISYYFFPYYYFDLENTLTFFIVGRYEFKNKGVDIFIKSLAALNEKLKAEKSDKTIIAFFWIPREVMSTKRSLAQNKISHHRIQHYIEEHKEFIEKRLVDNVMRCNEQGCFVDEKAFFQRSIFGSDFLKQVRQMRLAFTQEGNPPLSTHDISGEGEDVIIKSLVESGLDNREDDKVKVIFYPIYLSGVDGLIDLSYYDVITGCHLGLFPSYYEPWGYTPLESAALGVPSLTTDLGGYGRFLLSKDKGDEGVFVLKRHKRPEEHVVHEFTETLYNFTQLDLKERVDQKLYAKQTSNLADWKVFIDNYIKAHNLAIKKVYG